MVSYGTDITKCDSAAEFLDRAYNVETCDKQSFASQTIVLAIANKWYELHNNHPNALARRRRKMLVNHVIRINEENRRSADSPLLLCTS